MKKLIFSLILILLIFSSVNAFADEEIFSYSFLSEDESSFWSGCFYDESNPFGNGNSIFINNPFGQVVNDKITHVLEHRDTIHLDAGKVYTISGYILNPLSGYSPSIRTNAHLQSGANTIIVNISGIGDEWAQFSTTFYAGESGDYNLALHLADGFADFGFFADEITFSQTSCTLSHLQLSGQTQILIPSEGSHTSGYTPYLITIDNKAVNILSENSVYMSATKCDGVSFSSSDFTLTVESDAVSPSIITIECALRNFESLPPTFLNIELTDNMITDPHFNAENLLWTSSSNIVKAEERNNFCLSFPTNDFSDYGYFATLSYEKPQLLLGGTMYVMHARVKSDSPQPYSDIYAKNTAECIDSTIYFNIKDISGNGWIDVFAAFIPETSGIYNIALNLYSTYDCTIFVDDIRLSSETVKPQYITLHAPGNIAVPDISTDYPVNALLRDQLGNIINSPDITVSLLNGNSSVFINSQNNTLTVLPDAPTGEYTIFAYYNQDPLISSKLSFTVSYDYIGDGGFENKRPNEWWMVTSPYETDFYIRDDGATKKALINCKGDYFMLLNNSYVHLIQNTPYVFNSRFSVPTDCTATLFIESVNGDIIPLAQFFVTGGLTLDERISPELFLAEESVIGRLFLYIQSDNTSSFTAYIDNLSLKKASVLAGNLHISGNPHIDSAVSAEFAFYNSVTNNTDSSASIINWYISDSVSGEFTMLSTGGKYIYFDTSFLNKYVYFEVIPICPETGFSGDTVHCMPFKVTYFSDNNTSSEIKDYQMSIPHLSFATSQDLFSDINDHWANYEINLLAQNGIINGKSENIFSPDTFISRGEFSKIICNTFNLIASIDFSPFSDVRKNDWFYSYVNALYINEIINGVSENEFAPYSPISREDVTVILMRIYDKLSGKKIVPIQNEFNDSSQISQYALDSINKAARLGIINGKTLNQFCPKDYVTRAEATALVCRLVQTLIK